ncbi:hypothetical protein MPSI1_001492 [Malassezia psittaci]|uniref:Major facilitator superfamily (MFS) profile domain-containing protein n=1 Tax=Malassezia psittaci TaxID=1821823 RepID=A0AAF0F8W4_9BASI|nr:hypothetical protein MPSI1_001492 [Malassezia psittaci]
MASTPKGDQDGGVAVGSSAPPLSQKGAGVFSLVDPADAQESLVEETAEQEGISTADSTDSDLDLSWLDGLPWWKRPDPMWVHPLILLFALGGGIMLATRMEMYLSLICDEMGLEPGPSSSGLPHIPSSVCRQSPEAQRRLSSLQLVLLLTNGICCAFSAGFWAKMSDRKGRTRIMMVNVFGILIMDLFVLIASTDVLRRLPMGIHFLAIGSTIEGSLGGYSAVNALSLCYISDVTPSGTRARLFAMMTGVLFAGVAIGPTLGGYLTVMTGDVVVTLWTAAIMHAGIILSLLLVPESLLPSRRAKAEAARKESQRKNLDLTFTQRLQKAALTPFRTLSILMPQRVYQDYTAVPSEPDEETAMNQDSASSSAQGTQPSRPSSHQEDAYEVPTEQVYLSVPHTIRSAAWDVNLLLIGFAYFLESATVAIVPIKIQYVQLVFDWGSEMLGFFISFTALTRMLMLVAVLPLVIRLIHRPLRSVTLPQDDSYSTSPLDSQGHRISDDQQDSGPRASTTGNANDSKLEKQWVSREKLLRSIHDSRMDMRLAVISAVLTAMACVVTGIARSTWLFFVAILLTSIGSGVGSAVTSLAIALLRDENESGRLFGALAVLGTLSSSMVGPYLFTAIFRASAATAPSLVFFVISGMQIVAAAAVMAVHLRSPSSLSALPPRPK